VPQRFIALNLDDGPLLLVNPEIVWSSAETFTMWDDCMSFPSLMVKVQRHQSISVHFLDERGDHREWLHLNQATSELLQHEIDHLDGILAVDRAVDRESLVMREVFEAQRAYFARQVDYVIGG
jgi:peptide deformylase